MAYYEGTINDIGCNGNNSGFGNGWEGLIALALVFGNGGLFGNGFGGGRGGYGSPATVQDVASGFSTSEIMSDLNDIILGQSQGFANVQQTLCQGFAGVNASVTDVGYAIKDCCCQTQRAIDGVNYNLATQSNMLGRSIENGFAQTNYNLATQNCATLQAIDKVGDRVIDYLTQGELRKYRDSALVAQIKQEVNPCAIPSYPVHNPNCCYNYGVFPTGSCGASVQ